MSIYAIVILILVLFYTFYMGFNDGSTAIATTVVSRAVTPKQAIITASISKFIVPIALFLLGQQGLLPTLAQNL